MHVGPAAQDGALEIDFDVVDDAALSALRLYVADALLRSQRSSPVGRRLPLGRGREFNP